jgi:hypothetical protein
MLGQPAAVEQGAAGLTAESLAELATSLGRSAIVRDRHNALWRWDVDDRGWRPTGEDKATVVVPPLLSRMLVEQRGPISSTHVVEEGERALSVADLDAMITLHGDTAAVRDGSGLMWSWRQAFNGWRCLARDSALYATSEALHRDWSPLREG